MRVKIRNQNNVGGYYRVAGITQPASLDHKLYKVLSGECLIYLINIKNFGILFCERIAFFSRNTTYKLRNHYYTLL